MVQRSPGGLRYQYQLVAVVAQAHKGQGAKQEANEAPFHSVALGGSWMRPPISRGTQRSSDQIKMENMTQPEMHKLHGVQMTTGHSSLDLSHKDRTSEGINSSDPSQL